jgi:predicted regulator of Ras-like GTPase activity (Roadblock/LC7/MglB family)
MKTGLTLPVDLAGQIEHILADVYHKARAECVLLADVSGQLLAIQGQTLEMDPMIVAALAAGDVAALSELARQIGETDHRGSFLHEGAHKSIYLFGVNTNFILIVIFRADTPIGLVRLFAGRAVEQLHPLVVEFEQSLSRPEELIGADFGAALADELEEAFGEL